MFSLSFDILLRKDVFDILPKRISHPKSGGNRGPGPSCAQLFPNMSTVKNQGKKVLVSTLKRRNKASKLRCSPHSVFC